MPARLVLRLFAEGVPLRRLEHVDCTILNNCAHLGLQAVEETLKLKVTEHLHHVLADKAAQDTRRIASAGQRVRCQPRARSAPRAPELPSGAARGAVDDLELSESEEYSSDEPSSDSSDEYM